MKKKTIGHGCGELQTKPFCYVMLAKHLAVTIGYKDVYGELGTMLRILQNMIEKDWLLC